MRDACAVSGVIACTCAACVSLACVDYALLLCLSRRPPPAVSGVIVYGQYGFKFTPAVFVFCYVSRRPDAAAGRPAAWVKPRCESGRGVGDARRRARTHTRTAAALRSGKKIAKRQEKIRMPKRADFKALLCGPCQARAAATARRGCAAR